MSGIAGWVSAGPRLGATEAESRLEAMVERMNHRGPESAHFWADAAAGASIAHVGLSAFHRNADRPGLDEDDSAVAAVDGPVFVESGGDVVDGGAAAVLDAYRTATRFPTVLDGPHSLAVWDQRRRTLTLARDRLGEKPLYFWHDSAANQLVFASEVKSLLAHPAVRAQVDWTGVSLFLMLGWMPAPNTVFAGIEKLAPGELLEWDAARGVTRRRYWTLPPVDESTGDIDAFARRAKELYLRAVAKHVAGLDEVGVFLSGGVDSTMLLIALKELGVSRIHSFTLGLPDDSFQERNLDIPYARLMSERFGTLHQELSLKQGFDPTCLLSRVVRQFDDPILTPNCYTKYLLAAMADRAGVRAVLTGSGAGGGCGPYRRFRDPVLRRKVMQKIDGLGGDVDRFMRLRGKVLSLAEANDVLAADVAIDRSTVARRLEPYLAQIHAADFPRRYLLANLILTCPEKVCGVLDRSGLLASVDIRSPHLDRDLVEFQVTAPSSFDGGRTFVGIKCLLERAFADQMPREVLDREETGFPCYYWHRGELAAVQRRLFARDAIAEAGLFRHAAVERIVEAERLDTDSKSLGKRTWALTQLALWHAVHVRQDASWLDAVATQTPEALLGAVVQPISVA